MGGMGPTRLYGSMWVKHCLKFDCITIFNYIVATIKGGGGRERSHHWCSWVSMWLASSSKSTWLALTQLGIDMACVVLPVNMGRGVRLHGLCCCRCQHSWCGSCCPAPSFASSHLLLIPFPPRPPLLVSILMSCCCWGTWWMLTWCSCCGSVNVLWPKSMWDGWHPCGTVDVVGVVMAVSMWHGQHRRGMWHVACGQCGVVDVAWLWMPTSINTRGGARWGLEVGGGNTKKWCETGSSHRWLQLW